MQIELDQSYQILGTHGSYGIVRQVWRTPLGPVEQYAVTVPAPTLACPRASSHTCVSTRGEALALYPA